MLSIPNDKTPKTTTYSMPRNNRSNVQLLYDLLERISNDILFEDITAIKPTYTEDTEGLLIIVVEYMDY